MKKKNNWFRIMIGEPLIASITGFGMFSYYTIFDMNPLFSLFIALITSALMAKILSDK